MAWLPPATARPFSKALIRRLIMAGAVRVDARVLRRPAATLREGQRIEVAIDPGRLPAPPATPAAVRVLYEDADLLAVDKPPGLPTVPGADAARPSLVSTVLTMLAARGREAYLGVHQRLDRDTSGVVLFAKERRANPGLASAFAAHAARKTYHALAAPGSRRPPASWVAETPVAGKPARTDFCVKQVLARGLVIEARPLTGRKHQIRVHLAEAGVPILGDDRYGVRRSAPRLMLHAARLELAHPVTGATLVIESPWPDDFTKARDALARGGSSPR